MIVPDASVLVTALADDGNDGRAVRHRLVDEDLAGPELVDLEVTSLSTICLLWTEKVADRSAADVDS